MKYVHILYVIVCIQYILYVVYIHIHMYSPPYLVSTSKGTLNLYFLSEVLAISTG